ncbi:MAG: Spx/MgsR family RNA polymerase-binding regulatory protein [Pseudobdellovibrionaceae bacterium]
MLKVYEYSKCSTCVKALKFLEGNKVKYEKLPIVEKAPSQKELKQMLAAIKERGGNIKKLFNTSGVQYKEMKMSERINELTETEAIKLLSENGKLVKRPFVISDTICLVGFNEDEWKKVF